jgi:hypothetical protein
MKFPPEDQCNSKYLNFPVIHIHHQIQACVWGSEQGNSSSSLDVLRTLEQSNG